MKREYITKYLWQDVENSRTKIAKRVYDVLNYDVLSVVGDNKIFWFEKTYSEAKIPKYVYSYAKRLYKRLGYTYLYNEVK